MRLHIYYSLFPCVSRMRFSKASIIRPAICPSTAPITAACNWFLNSNRTSKLTFVCGGPDAPAALSGANSHRVERYSKTPSFAPGKNARSPDPAPLSFPGPADAPYFAPLRASTTNFVGSQSTREVNVSQSGPYPTVKKACVGYPVSGSRAVTVDAVRKGRNCEYDSTEAITSKRRVGE